MTANHGTETTGRQRGARVAEIYNNIFDFTTGPGTGEIRSGSVLTFNNSWPNQFPEHNPTVNNFRSFYPFKFWGGANGNNPLDSNDSRGKFASGTATASGSTASSLGTLIVAGAGWDQSANGGKGQWAGYSVTNTTQTFSSGAGQGFHPSSYIDHNTTDTIYFKYDDSAGPGMNFKAGDGFAIYKVTVALDQPCRGNGSLIAADDPVNSGVTWPNQALEPCFDWNNKNGNGALVPMGNTLSPNPTLQENRDYYNQTNSFNGSAGIGVGLLSARPSTGLTPGVAYFATDVGTQGTFYIATGSSIWSTYYQPHQYPHELVVDIGPPSNLTIR